MGEPLYERLSKVQIMFGVMSQDLRPQFPASAPAWLAELACHCWAASPAARSALPHLLPRQVHPEHVPWTAMLVSQSAQHCSSLHNTAGRP